MNILSMMWKNLLGGARTLRFPARPTVTKGYRGLVRFDPELCTGCAICRFRCTARAITFTAAKGTFTWSYDPGQCTFCGRCVDGCKSHALSQDQECPPVYLTVGSLRNSYTLTRKPPVQRPASPAAGSSATGSAPSEPASGGAA